VGVLFVLQLLSSNSGYKNIDTSQMVGYINSGQVKSETFIEPDQELEVTLADSETVSSQVLIDQQYPLLQKLQKQEAKGQLTYDVEVPTPSWLGALLSSVLPFLLIIVFFLILMNSVQGGGSKVMSFAKSKARLITKDTPKTTFDDVAGVQEAIEELGEIKEFLQEPAKFQAVGAKIPKGVLLYGQPGTGKTLLARAVAGEAGVPFYSISGSDFVEMFVGVGASRV